LVKGPDFARRIMLGELPEEAKSKARELEFELYGKEGSERPLVLRAILACRLGARLEDVASLLDWREFESFCADLLRTRGFVVSENVRVKRPRAQVDLLARSGLFSLAVDCKHWKKSMGIASLSMVIEAQRRRAKLLRSADPSLSPLASVVLLLSEEEPRFVGGGAVVPVRTLGSFVDGLAGFEELEFD
jgi:hypothetical protein